jgi:hypothetical protein
MVCLQYKDYSTRSYFFIIKPLKNPAEKMETLYPDYSDALYLRYTRSALIRNAVYNIRFIIRHQ